MLEQLKPRFVERVWGSAPWSQFQGLRIGEVWFDPPAATLVLVKFIFTSEKLSVQVHPDDEYAALHHDCRGKTEMWHILSATPGAQIAAGFREPIARERMREAALSGEIEHLLEWHSASPGDTFFIPAGTVHAIGAGIVLCEIQQPSDITYRIYDYGRLDGGRPRELHLDHALAISRREPHAPRQNHPVSCKYFNTERHVVKGRKRLTAGSIFVVIEGQGEIGGQPVRAGEVWHSTDESVEVAGEMALLGITGPS